jgi:hypothetical protein
MHLSRISSDRNERFGFRQRLSQSVVHRLGKNVRVPNSLAQSQSALAIGPSPPRALLVSRSPSRMCEALYIPVLSRAYQRKKLL